MSAWWSGRRVLVTGAGGFVGGHLCRALMEEGASLVATDARSWPWPTARVLRAEPSERLPLDVTDFAGTLGCLGAVNPSVIFHLAGVSHIAAAQADPMAAWTLNVGGAVNVLEAARRTDVEAVVLASSNHVYGWGAAHCEFDLPGQADVYGTSKASVDMIARCYQEHWLAVSSLRHVNCYGPADPHESHLVTGTICSLLRGEVPIIRGDGTATKGYLHVDDVVTAYLLLAERTAGGWYNAGPGDAWPVLSIVDRLIQLSGHDVVPEILNADRSQSGYVEILKTDKLLELGWRPRLNLSHGLLQTYEWYRAHKGMAWLP